MPQWYMNTPASLARKRVADRLAGIDVPEGLVRGDPGGVEVDRVRDRAVVRQRDLHELALPHVDHGPRRATGPGPGAVLDARSDLDDAVGQRQVHVRDRPGRNRRQRGRVRLVRGGDRRGVRRGAPRSSAARWARPRPARSCPSRASRPSRWPWPPARRSRSRARPSHPTTSPRRRSRERRRAGRAAARQRPTFRGRSLASRGARRQGRRVRGGAHGVLSLLTTNLGLAQRLDAPKFPQSCCGFPRIATSS